MTFIIAEIGVNHNGELAKALELVEASSRAGASAAKFQTFNAAALAAPNTGTVAYQKASGADDQFAMLKSLELSEADHRVIARRCAELGIEFMSTAFDSGSLDLLCDIGIKRIKVPSGEVTNFPYLSDCARRGLPIILSTGMADLGEVREAVAFLRSVMPLPDAADAFELPSLTVLHCTSAYPTTYEDVNLSAMTTMARELGVTVGYSDHTTGILVPPIAVALGARVIEKHVTLDRMLPGPDHAASIEPGELADMVSAISSAELLVGDGVKAARPAEYEARALVRRGLKAARDLPAGTILQEADIAILRPATGLAPKFFYETVGKQLRRPLSGGAPIGADDIR
ncbi:N-acetylneuraminate synthase [Mesorhizobium loti]|nr:N-acetylneuraminate synthase family protein [Mesorhizobium loti]PLP60068.1 N-acetylneuraminate synthase [Mesorhizobium loti]